MLTVRVNTYADKNVYSSSVWDGCTEQDKTALETLLNKASRIVTGLTRSTSILTYIKNVLGLTCK